MNALFCPKRAFEGAILYVCFCSNCEFNKKDGNLLFSKLIDFDGIFKLFYAPFSTKF